MAREYIDEAESGRIADRPQFRRMIDEGGKATAPFRVILVWKFSRFTRKQEQAVAFKSMLRRKDVQVVSITEHADDSPTGKLRRPSLTVTRKAESRIGHSSGGAHQCAVARGQGSRGLAVALTHDGYL